MSFVIAALPFMQVNLSSEGGDGIDAFSIAPIPATESTLRDHSIVFRTRRAGFSLFYLANPAASAPPVSAITRRTRFSFTMTLNQREFFSRFHPDFASGAPQIRLDNLDAGGAILTSGPLSSGATVEDVDSLPVGGNPYPARVDLTGGSPQRVDAKDRFSGATVGFTEFESENAATEAIVPVKVAGFADPAVRLVAAAPSTLDEVVYADDAAADAGAAGVIDLYWDQHQTAVPAMTGAVFDVVFRPRA